MYLERQLKTRFTTYLQQFPCVLLLGARQVGKSTFVRRALSGWQHIDLEQPSQAALVAEAPELFLRDHPRQIWFDEAQRLPELFTALRHAIDQDRRPGRFVLSGSASPALVRGVSEYLAGRVGILHLGPFTAAEQVKLPPPSFLEFLTRASSAEDLLNTLQEQPAPAAVDLRALWLRGGYPEPALLPDPVAAWR